MMVVKTVKTKSLSAENGATLRVFWKRVWYYLVIAILLLLVWDNLFMTLFGMF